MPRSAVVSSARSSDAAAIKLEKPIGFVRAPMRQPQPLTSLAGWMAPPVPAPFEPALPACVEPPEPEPARDGAPAAALQFNHVWQTQRRDDIDKEMKIEWSHSWGRRFVRAATISLVACSAVGCGGAPLPKPLSAQVVITSRESGNGSSTPLPPAGVIAVGRARDYRQWVKLEQASPVVAFLKRKLIEEAGNALLEDWDLTQPVEFVVSYDPGFRRTSAKPAPRSKPETEGDEALGDEGKEATSKPNADSSEDFLAAFSVPLTRYAPESYAKHGFKPWTANAYESGNCLVTSALGSAKARLICGDRPDSTHHLYDYVAHGLPLEPLSPAPIFVEFRPQPLKSLWAPLRDEGLRAARDWAASGGNTSHLAEQLSLDVAKEVDMWVASADTLRFEAGPNERDEFEGSLTFALRQPEPWLVQSFLASAAKVHGAPSAFSNLPKEVGAAWYGYGLPAERSAVLQSALVNLAKTAFQEYGPASHAALDAKDAKAIDRLVPELIDALDSPCIVAEQTVLANLPADPAELAAYTSPKQVKLVKQPKRAPLIPSDVVLRAMLGQYLVAVPSAAKCTQFTEHGFDMLMSSLQALPAKERKKLPLALSVRKNVKFAGLPPATVARISLTKQVVTDLMKELEAERASKRDSDSKSADSPLSRWGAPKGPIVLSLMIVPNSDATGSDWFGFGLDEKQLVQSLLQATHPVPGQTLAARVDLAPFIAQNPTSLGFQSFEAYSRLLALVGGPEFGPALTGLQSLFHGTNIVSTRSIKMRGNVAEANASYYLSKDGLAAVRQLLNLDIEHLLELAKMLNQNGAASE